jgi:hypothetical protein
VPARARPAAADRLRAGSGGAARIERALRSLRGAPIFTGGRGRTAVDAGAAARLIERCGELLLEHGLELVELNPVIVAEHGAVAVDASIRLGMVPATSV